MSVMLLKENKNKHSCDFSQNNWDSICIRDIDSGYHNVPNILDLRVYCKQNCYFTFNN